MENTELQISTSEITEEQEIIESEVIGDEVAGDEVSESEVTDDTELNLENQVLDSTEVIMNMNSELIDDDHTVGDLEALVNSALNEYFEQNTIRVVIVGDGIHKPLGELTLTEVCLVIIVLILLGRSILHIIGGRAWKRS